MRPSDMEQQRNIRLLISLVVLTVITVIVFFAFDTRQRVTVDTALFRVDDFTVIDKVVLTTNQRPIELTFDGGRWKVNGQLADRSMIDVLFAALQQAEPKRPVAESLRDSVNAMLEANGTTVQLYEGDNLQKQFVAGGNMTKTQAYFKRMDDATAYVMVIPGYRVYTSGIFEMEEHGWKDRYVFNFNWRNFKSLNASYPTTPANDFEVAMGEAYFEIMGMPSADTTKLNDFLDAVSLLEVDQYVKASEVEGYDSLVAGQPDLQLEVHDISGKRYTLALYRLPDQPHMVGVLNGVTPALIDQRKVAGLFRERNWFLKK
jgi:hypothetical protein